MCTGPASDSQKHSVPTDFLGTVKDSRSHIYNSSISSSLDEIINFPACLREARMDNPEPPKSCMMDRGKEVSLKHPNYALAESEN